jgi:hypothetical protein
MQTLSEVLFIVALALPPAVIAAGALALAVSPSRRVRKPEPAQNGAGH